MLIFSPQLSQLLLDFNQISPYFTIITSIMMNSVVFIFTLLVKTRHNVFSMMGVEPMEAFFIRSIIYTIKNSVHSKRWPSSIPRIFSNLFHRHI